MWKRPLGVAWRVQAQREAEVAEWQSEVKKMHEKHRSAAKRGHADVIELDQGSSDLAVPPSDGKDERRVAILVRVVEVHGVRLDELAHGVDVLFACACMCVCARACVCACAHRVLAPHG